MSDRATGPIGTGLAEVSFIVRTRDSARTLERALRSIKGQTVPAEIVVVDSGSTDSTVEIADRLADQVARIEPEAFTYGGALNLGASVAAGSVHVALSSHCELPRADWIEVLLAHMRRDEVIAACGAGHGPTRRPLSEPVDVDRQLALRHAHWGFSNHASAWRAQVWACHPFREDLPASEDKEWSWRALSGGGILVMDPALVVAGHHRREGGSRRYYGRLRKELSAHALLRPLPRYTALDAARDFARREPHDPWLSQARRFGRTRLIEVAARWQVGRMDEAVSMSDVPIA